MERSRRIGWRFGISHYGLRIAHVFLLSGLLWHSTTYGGDREHLELIQQQDEVDRAVERAVKWLAAQQDPVSGAFKGKLPNTYTGLSCIALMAAGHFPDRSEYGDHLRRGIMYLVDTANAENGYLGRESNGRMYAHGICALALTEAYGMMGSEEDNLKVKQAAEKALRVILHAQSNNKHSPHHGGWRYEPHPRDADLSLTVWQVLALRSAQNCRLNIPDKAIADALDYVRRTYHDGHEGFAYQPNQGPSTAMRCAGIVCMQALGANEKPEDQKKINKATEFLLDLDPAKGSKWFFYQTYYVITAANMAGVRHRETMLPKTEKFLLTLQQKDGEFKNYHGHDGGVYATAFCVICLAVRYQYLPIYQE